MKILLIYLASIICCIALVNAGRLSFKDMENADKFAISLNKWTDLQLNFSGHKLILHIGGIPENVTFLKIQAHSFRDPIILASQENATYGEYVTSTSVGMTTLLRPGQREASWFLGTGVPMRTTARVLLTSYNQYDPVPGACNQEFPLRYDPNLHVNDDPNVNKMEFQYSNRGFKRVPSEILQPDCESEWDILYYDVYIYYMTSQSPSKREHFDAVKRMATVKDIEANGKKMLSLKRGRGYQPKALFMGYPGQGVVYNVIVTQIQGHLIRRSAYVPSTTYSCNLYNGHPDSCNSLDDRTHPYKACAVFTAIMGGLLMLFAHRFFKCHMFAFGFLPVTLVAFILLRLTVTLEPMAVFWVASMFGVIGGVLWVLFWWYVGVPILSILLVGFTAGYLLASVVFYTPFDNMKFLRYNFNYGMIFACWVLLFNIFFLPWPRRLSILASSLIGSYSIVFVMGLFVNSSVSYIFINSVRKAVIPQFIEAIPTYPHFLIDIILCVIWVVLFILAAIFQFYQTRNDPEFPPCPRRERREDFRRFIDAEESANEDDLSGLLSQVSYPSYNSLDSIGHDQNVATTSSQRRSPVNELPRSERSSEPATTSWVMSRDEFVNYVVGLHSKRPKK